MAKPRTYCREDSQAGLYHVISRVCGRQFLLTAEGKERFVAMMHALAAFCHVQVLTYCVMDNHFHLLLRVPKRPAGLDLPLEEVQRLWHKAVGKEWSAAVKSQHEIFRQAGAGAAIEEWRQRMLGRMFSLSEFVKALKQRFTQWYNRQAGRCGTLWESRYTSVMVEDEGRALRTMAAYIDLNPVRAGHGSDPAGYRWCGYAAAMAGGRAAQQGLARIVHGGRLEEEMLVSSGSEAVRAAVTNRRHGGEEQTLFPSVSKARRMRALLTYRQILGVQGRPRVREDGKVVQRGISAAVQSQLASESATGVRSEMLRRRIVHLTRGVIFGSRAFIDEWFERNRSWFRGRSREQRRTGARSTGEKALRGLYTLRQLGGSG